MTVSRPPADPAPRTSREIWDERVATLYHEPVDMSAPRWDLPYPDVPPGWTLGPPDFIGVGAQKAGTSWWYRLLTLHPGVVDPVLKETHHLVTLGWRPMNVRDVLSYHRFFPRPAGAVAGEWTPRYMSTAGVVDTMHACAPEARILVILRDPIERYRSGVAQWMRGKEKHRRQNLRLARGREDALVRSFYGFQLRPVIEAYGSDRVLVQQFERCQADPTGEYRRLLGFLGLDDWIPPDEAIGLARNVAPTPATAQQLGELGDAVRLLEDDVGLLRRLVPDLDLALWPNFRHLA